MQLKTCAATACVFAACAILAACQPSTDWKEYSYPTHNFAVSFYAPPATRTLLGFFVTEMSLDADDYAVTQACVPASTDSDDTILQRRVDDLKPFGTLHTPLYVATGHLIGREVDVDKPDGRTLRARIFVKDKCIYEEAAQSQRGPDDPLAVKFLDSFRLLHS